MPIDARIPLAIQPIESPLNKLAKFESVRASQRLNAMADLKMREYDETVANRNKLREYMSGTDLSSPEGRSGLLKFGDAGIGVSEALTNQEQGKFNSQKLETEAVEGRLGLARQFLDQINTPDQVAGWLQSSYDDPVLGGYLNSVGVPIEKSFDNFKQALQLPGGFEQWKMNAGAGIEKNMEHMRQLRQQDITKYGYDLSAETQRRGQDLTDNREWWKARSADRAGQLTNDPEFQKNLARVKALGKKEGETVNDRRKELTDLDTTIGLIADIADSEIDPNNPNKGLINKSTSGGAGALADSLVEFFGGSTEGDIAIAKLQPIADKALKQVPRFEGPQGVMDVQSYKEAAGNLADPLVSKEKRREAALTIISLMKKRQGQLTGAESPTGQLAAPVGGAGLPAGSPIPPPTPRGGTELMRGVPSLPQGYSIEWEN